MYVIYRFSLCSSFFYHTPSLFVPLALLLLRVVCPYISRSLVAAPHCCRCLLAAPPVFCSFGRVAAATEPKWQYTISVLFLFVYFPSVPSPSFYGASDGKRKDTSKKEAKRILPLPAVLPLVIILVISLSPPHPQLRPLWEGRSRSHLSDWRALCLSSRTTRHSPPHPP